MILNREKTLDENERATILEYSRLQMRYKLVESIKFEIRESCSHFL